MSALPLRLGPLLAEGFVIHRSGVTWLCADGHLCRPNEVIGYCSLGIDPAPGLRTAARSPFAEEEELQVAFAPRVAGRLRQGAASSHGGYLDVHRVQPWDEDAAIGVLEAADGDDEPPDAARTLRLLLLAGQRVSPLADGYTGLLPGWHRRSRGWWCDPPGLGGAPGEATLLSMGVCDSVGAVRGDRAAFTELFAASVLPAHIVFMRATPITPCAAVLAEQLARSPAQFQAIAADLHAALAGGKVVPDARDWLFAGMLLDALGRSPIRDSHPLLTPTGLRRSRPADAILLSLTAEFTTLLRHRRLGYCLHVMRHYQSAAGPAIRAWLAAAFEPVRQSVDDIARGYARLSEMVAAETGARCLVVNRMSTSGQEDVTSYAAFDAPLGDTLSLVSAKEENLMLHDLAQAHDIGIIDVDAIAAELGGAAHLPDGVHQSGLMQAAVRAELLHCLHGRQHQAAPVT